MREAIREEIKRRRKPPLISDQIRQERSEIKTLYQWRCKYEGHMAHTYRPRTYARYAFALEEFFGRLAKGTKPHEVTRRMVREYIAKRTKVEGQAESTVDYEIKVCQTFYNWMMEITKFSPDPIAYNPFTKLDEFSEVIKVG